MLYEVITPYNLNMGRIGTNNRLCSVLFLRAIGGQTCMGMPPVPAHTERLHAAVSYPAVASDNSLYLVNGPHLWHYSADHQLVITSYSIHYTKLYDPNRHMIPENKTHSQLT